MKTLIVAAAGLALAACAHIPTAKQVCLPMRAYTAAQQMALADALASLPATSPISGVVGDYIAMRDADRACLAARP
jgi:hypothetical protein